MIWFLLGAGLGVAQMAWSLVRKPIHMGYPIQGFLAAAVLGALVYGTILWLLANYVFS